jgi:prepilin-type N-terminal cleavage/methylation domain-containing protein
MNAQPCSYRMRNNQWCQGGFTLLEVTVVLVLIAILGMASLGLTKPCCGDGRVVLARAEHAVMMFARTNGRLPCADINGDGEEDCGSGVGSVPWRLLGVEKQAVQPKGAILLYQPHMTLADPVFTGTGGHKSAYKLLHQRVQATDAEPFSTTQPHQAGPGPGYGDCASSPRRLGYLLIVVRDASSLNLPCVPYNRMPETWVDVGDPLSVLTASLAVPD